MDKTQKIVKNTLSSNLIKTCFHALNEHYTISQIERMTIKELDSHLELLGKLKKNPTRDLKFK